MIKYCQKCGQPAPEAKDWTNLCGKCQDKNKRELNELHNKEEDCKLGLKLGIPFASVKAIMKEFDLMPVNRTCGGCKHYYVAYTNEAICLKVLTEGGLR